jgi:predicted dehydrogenase
VAVIGVRNRGAANLEAVRHENVVALCDVDARYLASAAEQIPGAAVYRDFRVMLERMPEIEAVVISTPDHVHAPAAAMSLRMGKHVYCEKPLTHTVEEARTLARLAREQGVATQMGTQIHAGDNYRRVVELIQSGIIGPVREVHVWCNKSWSNGRFGPTKPVPEHLDWDLWLGPAAARPYCDGLHPANWRRFWDYGTGTLGDMGCHYLDLVHWALDLRHPVRVQALGPARHDVGTPHSLIVRWDHPERDGRPAVRVTWYDGENRPSILAALRRADGTPISWGDGHLFVGEHGMLLSDYGRHLLLPEERFAEATRPDPVITGSTGHHREWLHACRTGSYTTCNFEYAGALTEAVLLGNVAFRVGRPIRWDAPTMTAPDAPEADRFIRRPYRDGWSL